MASRRIKGVFQELKFAIEEQVTFFHDSGAAKIETASQSTARTRHLDFKLQYTRETAVKENINIRHVSIETALRMS